MNHGSLFSGIGGFDLAAEWMGWENKFHCEWNEFGQRILEYYWPKAESYGDITQADFTIWRGRIDVLTGGFPCQPYSTAGKRLGKEDDRHLWPEMLRAIREIKPKYIVGENVAGIVSWNGGLVFNEVQVDLENEGYEVQPIILPAASVNAPHRRDRVWFVANAIDSTDKRGSGTNESESEEERLQERNGIQLPEKSSTVRSEVDSFIANSDHTRADNSMRVKRTGQEVDHRQEGQPLSESRQDGGDGNASDSHSKGLQRRQKINEWEELNTKSGRDAFKFRASGKSNGGRTRCYFKNFPTQSPICSRDDGFSDRLDGITFPKWRNESIKGYGNAIVPQVAFEIFKVIQQIDERNS